MKNILLPIIGVAIFIALVGLLTKKAQNLRVTQKQEVSTKKEVSVGNTKVKVDIADSETARRNGLSGRPSLNEDEGMLFVFGQKDILPSFWMKDMKIAIDIIWINDGKITKIDKNVPPPEGIEDKDLKLYNPDKPIDYVLEVNAGFSDKNGIKVGDSVEGLP